MSLKEHGRLERYLKPYDFIEVQLGNVENDLCPHSEIVKLIVGLIDLLDVDKIVNLCFDNDKSEVLFTSIQLLSWRAEAIQYKQEFILSMFN